MHPIPDLKTLGRRICICGPSSSGKSTLATALSRKLGIKVVHLDQLHHQPHTDWQPRPREEFVALHEIAIADEEWVMEGNYTGLYSPRFARATGIILMKAGRWPNLCRYIRRTLRPHERVGQLEGAVERINWKMIHWIMVATPRKRDRQRELIRASGLPVFELDVGRDLQRVYKEWDLTR